MTGSKRSNHAGVLTSGESISYWLDSVKPLEFETLTRNMETAILIIGAGIAGLTTAYLLSKAGIKITLVEDGVIGSGESGRTTAHLTCALDDRFYEIEKAFGSAGARKAAESHTAAINLIEKIVRDENIDCGFERVNGYLFLHPSDKIENLQKPACKRNGSIKCLYYRADRLVFFSATRHNFTFCIICRDLLMLLPVWAEKFLPAPMQGISMNRVLNVMVIW